MTAVAPPDAAARRIAATEFTTNLVVRAGAGTGKTSLLVERVLNAVGTGLAQIDRLAAITFTEKASGELRERIADGLERLYALAGGSPAGDSGREADRAFAYLIDEMRVDPHELSARCLHALESLDRASVTTIHGFCSELLRAHPLEAGIDPDFVVDTGEHADDLLEAAWESFLQSELGPRAPRAKLWRRLLATMPLEAARGVARELADFGIPRSLLEPPFRGPGVQEIFGEAAAGIAREIEDLLERQRGLSEVPLSYFETARLAFDALSAEGLPGFRRVVDSSQRLRKHLDGSRPKMNTRLAGVSREEADALARRVRDLGKRLRAIHDEPLELLVEAVAPFALRFREEFLRQGFVSFNGLLTLARDLLRDRSEVRRRLKQRYRMLLVDELQDTDPVQYEIVLLLAEPPDDCAPTAFEATLDPGRLFVVGDAKQSIYRFRGADYAAYQRVVDRIVGCGGRDLELTGNFRSVPAVLDPVNRLFGPASTCWNASAHQPDYRPIESARTDPADGERVELWWVDVESQTKADVRREAEGRLIAREIEQQVASGRWSYAQFTILFRAFTNISYYLRSLREQGIPFVVDGGREFLRRPEVAQLMAALRVLAQPADAAALLAFLRSPAGAVADTELAGYSSQDGSWSFWRDDVDGDRFPRIAAAFRTLRDLHRETRDLPADALIRLVVERTLQLPLGAAAYEGPQRVANLRKLAAAAGELARDGRLSLEQVVEALREGRLQDIETDRPLSDDAAEAVRITSIHRMKGLENDWVFLPDLARGSRQFDDRSAVRVARLPGGRETLAVMAGDARNLSRVWYELEHRQHEKAEEVRVLYVALTRARERLVVVAGPAQREAKWITALAPWGFSIQEPPEDGALLAGSSVRHRRLFAERRARRALPRPNAGTDSALEAYETTLKSLREKCAPPIASPSGLHDDVAPPERSSVSPGRDLAKAVGVVVHDLLEGWSFGDPEELRGRVGPACRTTAAVEAVEPGRLLDETREIVESLLASPLVRRLEQLEVLGREIPILLRRPDGTRFRGSIDLLCRDSEGRVLVVDYKTDRDIDPDRMRRRHGPQLRVYSEAVARAGHLLPPRAELWLLRSGQAVPVDVLGEA